MEDDGKSVLMREEEKKKEKESFLRARRVFFRFSFLLYLKTNK